MIYKFSVHSVDCDDGPAFLQATLPDIELWRDYYLQVSEQLTNEQIDELVNALGNPITERVEPNVSLRPGMMQVAYKRGIVDNENDSVVALAHLLGISAVAAKVATTYRSAHPALPDVIREEAFNSSIEELHLSEPAYDSLLPTGGYSPVEKYDLSTLSETELKELGQGNGRSLGVDKMLKIKDIQNELELAIVTDVMLEALDARWSDHCAHTTWRSLGNLLKTLVRSSEATANPNIVSMFHDNAGIWDFYDGFGIAIKAETHNGPSAVSAYFGQLTKVGGVLRDILGTGKGADPIGVFEYTATGLPDSTSPIAGRPAPKKIARETIRAVKEYGNTFGVPMMNSHMTFNDAYRAKPLALGGSIGLIPLEHAEKGRPMAGDLVMLLGGLTGNDGIHGASASSAGAEMDTASVQIGSPLEEIKFREAILDLRDRHFTRAVTDLGAAGLNSAAGEMGEGVGVWINTALVPLKTGGLPMWRILLSESQERMLLALGPESLDEARSILDRHEVRNAVIGRFTGDEKYRVVHDDDITEKHVIELDVTSLPAAREVGFELPYSVIDYLPEQVSVAAPRRSQRAKSEWPVLETEDLPGLVPKLLMDAELYDQSLASSQYDSTVQGIARYGPLVGEDLRVPAGYWAATPLYGTQNAVVFNTSFNPWLYAAHPVLAARQCFMSLVLTQVLAGVGTQDVCLCDNFYTPHLEPDSHAWLVGMVNELASLAETFGTPFVSGKDSSAGSTDTDEGIISVPPAVFLSALGKAPDVDRLRPETWSAHGNLLVRIGLSTPGLAGTVIARVLDLDAEDVDDIDVTTATAMLASVGRLPLETVPSARVIGPGGVLGAVLLGSMASGYGVDLDSPQAGSVELLHEHRVGALIEVRPEDLSHLPSDLFPTVVGRITDRAGSVLLEGTELMSEAALRAWSSTYEQDIS